MRRGTGRGRGSERLNEERDRERSGNERSYEGRERSD